MEKSIHKKNKKLVIYLPLYTKMNSKCTTDSNMKHKTYKTSTRKHQRKSTWPWVWQRFRSSTKSTIYKTKTDKLDVMKIKNFCSEKLLREEKDNLQTGRKDLQVTYSIKGMVFNASRTWNFKSKKTKLNFLEMC